MKKEIWRRGRWSVLFCTNERWCRCEYSWGGGPIIRVLENGDESAHWHTTRLWGRNRTTTDCVGLALAHIAQQEIAAQREQNEAELAKAEAEALADFATDISGDFGMLSP